MRRLNPPVECGALGWFSVNVSSDPRPRRKARGASKLTHLPDPFAAFAFQWGRAAKQEATTAKHHARRPHIHISSGVAFSARLYFPMMAPWKELIQRSSFICFGPENPEFIA